MESEAAVIEQPQEQEQPKEEIWENAAPEAPPKKEKPSIRFRKRRARKSEELRSPKMITEYEGRFRIQFPEQDREKLEPEILAIPGMVFEHRVPYDPDQNTPFEQLRYVLVYSIRQSAEALQEVAKIGRRHKFVFDSDLSIRAYESTEEAKTLEKMSYAKDSPGFEVPRLRGKLYPFQKAGIEYALRAKRTFIADEMGLGKTVQAIGTAVASGKIPWLLIVPASLKSVWFRHLKAWTPKRTKISIVKDSDLKLNKRGNISAATEEYFDEYDYYIVNYDRLVKWNKYLKEVPWAGVTFDESHYVKGRAAKRTKAAYDLITTVDPEYVLMLSGTPLMNHPLDFIPQLRILGRLNDFGGYNNFAMRYCTVSTSDASHMSRVAEQAQRAIDEGKNPREYTLGGPAPTIEEIREAMIRKLYENMTALNSRLRSICYVRREKKDVLTDLPEKQRTTIPLAITNRETYERIEADVISYLGEQAVKNEEFLKSIKKLSPENKLQAIRERRASQEYKSARAEALAKINALKKAAVAGKMKAVKEWIHNFLESGQKLVVFAHHHIFIDELIEEFGKIAVHSRTEKARAEAETRFQEDPKIKLFIGSMKKDGVGLTLTAASSTAFIELGWTPAAHDQAEDRVHRIGQKSAVTAYYLLAARTIEERIAALIERKREAVNATATGDPLKGKEQGSILGALLNDLTFRSGKLLDNSRSIRPGESDEDLPDPTAFIPKSKKVKKTKKGSSSAASLAKQYAKQKQAKKAAKKKASKPATKKATKKAAKKSPPRRHQTQQTSKKSTKKTAKKKGGRR